jgi:hypothetical protein
MEARERKTPLSPTCCFNFGYEDGGCFISKFQIGQTSDDPLDLYPAISVDLKASAVQVRIRSRSTSGNPPRTTIISRRVVAAVAVSVSVHGSASDLDCPIASIIWLDDGEQVQGRARKPINPLHRHQVAGRKRPWHLQQLAPVRPRTACRLAVNFRAAFGVQLQKLSVERLPISTDRSITEPAGFGG